MKTVKLDMSKTQSLMQNDAYSLENHSKIYKNNQEDKAFLSLSKSKFPDVPRDPLLYTNYTQESF